jgi:ABC-2 type transport system permease protein
MLVAGLALGFRSSASFIDWLAIAGILVLFTFSFSWLMAIVGVLAKSVEGVQWLSFVIIFPLTFASSAFVPTEGMNKFLRAFAENQPISQVIEAVRALMLNQPLGDHGFWAIFWCLIILVIAIPLATLLFKNKTNS